MKVTRGYHIPEAVPDSSWTRVTELDEPSFRRRTRAIGVAAALLLAPVYLIALPLRIELQGVHNLTIYVIGCLLLIPLHEGAHILAWPAAARRQVRLCISIRAVAVASDCELSRTRYLVSVVMPFTLLTLLPLPVMWALGTTPVELALLPVTHATQCGGDLLNFHHVISRVPVDAQIRDSGMFPYWRAPASSCAA